MKLRNWFHFLWGLKCSRGEGIYRVKKLVSFFGGPQVFRGKGIYGFKKSVPFFVGPQVFFANYLA